MQQSAKAFLATLALVALPGCIAKTVVGVVTAPVRVAGKAVDLATTSQSEADEKRGREMRRSEERLGRLERDYQRHSRQCDQGNDRACTLAEAERAEIADLGATMPPRGADGR